MWGNNVGYCKGQYHMTAYTNSIQQYGDCQLLTHATPYCKVASTTGWYCVSSVCSFCIGVFGSQTVTISRYFVMNRTIFEKRRSAGIQNFQKSRSRLTIPGIEQVPCWAPTDGSWHDYSALWICTTLGYESLPWTRRTIYLHFETWSVTPTR